MNLQSTAYPGTNYTIQEYLGEKGQEGITYKGMSLEKYYAIKFIKKQISQKDREFIDQLIKSQNKFKHLVRIQDFITSPQQAIVMELAHGNLEQLMKLEEFRKRTINEKHKLFLQVVDGALELDNLGFYHGNLKPKNILFFQQQSNLLLKIGNHVIDSDLKEGNNLEIYQSPEQSNGKQDKQIDIWALGIIWFKMMGLEDIKLLANQKQQKEIDQCILKCFLIEKQLQNILSQMLQVTPEKRIDIKNLHQQLHNVFDTFIPNISVQIKQKSLIDLKVRHPLINGNISKQNFDQPPQFQPNFVAKQNFQDLQKSDNESKILGEIKLLLFAWQQDLNQVNSFENELDEIINYEELLLFKKYVQEEIVWVDEIQQQKQGLNRQLINKSKQVQIKRNEYLEKIKEKFQIQKQKQIQLLECQKQFIKELRISSEELQGYRNLDKDFHEMIKDLKIIDQEISKCEKIILNQQTPQSYQYLTTQKQSFDNSIQSLQNKINQLRLISEQITLKMRTEQQLKNEILQKCNTAFSEVQNQLEGMKQLLEQNQILFLGISQEYQILHHQLSDLKSLIDEGTEDLLRLSEMQNQNIQNSIFPNPSIKYIQDIIDDEKDRIKKIEELIIFCNGHLVTYNNKISNDYPKLQLQKQQIVQEEQELKDQLFRIKQQISTFELDKFQFQAEIYQKEWKEKQKIMDQTNEQLAQLLKESNITQVIIIYLQIIIKLHQLNRFQSKLIHSNDQKSKANTGQISCNNLIFQQIKKEDIFKDQTETENKNKLKVIDSEIKRYEHIISQILITEQINYDYSFIEKYNDELNQQLRLLKQEIKEQIEIKLKYKFRSPNTVSIIMQKVESLEFNQGKFISLINEEIENIKK